MMITRKDRIKKPFKNATGERIYELIGRPERLGGAIRHSFGYGVIPPGRYSRPHYHPKSEETYAILKGRARISIDGKNHALSPGDVVFIQPMERHQIFSKGKEDLEFIVVCAPAWEPKNSVFLD